MDSFFTQKQKPAAAQHTRRPLAVARHHVQNPKIGVRENRNKAVRDPPVSAISRHRFHRIPTALYFPLRRGSGPLAELLGGASLLGGTLPRLRESRWFILLIKPLSTLCACAKFRYGEKNAAISSTLLKSADTRPWSGSSRLPRRAPRRPARVHPQPRRTLRRHRPRSSSR